MTDHIEVAIAFCAVPCLLAVMALLGVHSIAY